MKLTASEMKLIIWAIGIAIESEDSLIDAYRTGYDIQTLQKIVPPCHKPIEKRCLKTIGRLKKLKQKLQ